MDEPNCVVVQYFGAEAPEAGQFHLGGGFTSSRVGFCRVFQHYNGQTFSMDLWAEAAPCLKGVLFLPSCTSSNEWDRVTPKKRSGGELWNFKQSEVAD